MAASHMQTKTLKKVANNVRAITAIGATRVAEGFTNYADTFDWENAIKALTANTQGWFSCWLNQCDNMAENELGTFQIAGELAVYVPHTTGSDMQVAWDLALDVVDKLLAAANYSAGEAKPSRLSVKLHKIISDGGPGVCIFDFGAYGGGVMEFVDP